MKRPFLGGLLGYFENVIGLNESQKKKKIIKLKTGGWGELRWGEGYNDRDQLT